tara:strand:+ start:4568 stop:5398 length:831 start_codon:yes stop_codon:yes gene_type:complete
MSFKNTKVLEFYDKLPFNIYGDLKAAEEQIKKFNPLNIYPEIKKIIERNKKAKIIDFGCGGGWLVNSLSYHLKEKIEVSGVDFNPKVIDYANKLKFSLNLNSNFICSDLFTFNSEKKYDLIISLGVLHHTNNCEEAIKYISKFGSLNSYVFLGLYHKYGREPFLKYFKNMIDKSDDYKFQKYKSLHSIKDEKKLYSWFRDQVLHPHETQHTFEEVKNIFDSIKYKIISTSINKFEKIKKISDIILEEKKLKKYSEEKIKKNEYYPGFFITVAKKDS